jgi:hypothetical protein
MPPPYYTDERAAPSPALRWALALWVAVGVAVAVRTLVQPEQHTVFPLLASSAVHWQDDLPLYVEYQPFDYFRYPPAFAVAIAPLAALGLRAGGILWGWLNLATYGAGLWRFRRDVLPEGWTPGQEAAYYALALAGALRGLWNGQSNALAVGLLLLAAAAVARRRWWRGAGLLAGAVWLKLTPLAPALLLCALWPRRLAPRFALALALGALVPFLSKPPATALWHYREWAEHLTETARERWPGFRDGWTVWLVTRQVLFAGHGDPLPLREPLDAPAYRVLQLLTAAGCLAWCLWQRRRGAGRRRLVLLTLGIGAAWLMLFGPAVEHATYAFLAPLLAWALVERDAWPRGRGLVVTAGVLVLVLGWGALTRPLADALPPVLATLPIGTALYLVWLVGYARACRPAAETAPRVPVRSAYRRSISKAKLGPRPVKAM